MECLIPPPHAFLRFLDSFLTHCFETLNSLQQGDITLSDSLFTLPNVPYCPPSMVLLPHLLNACALHFFTCPTVQGRGQVSGTQKALVVWPQSTSLHLRLWDLTPVSLDCLLFTQEFMVFHVLCFDHNIPSVKNFPLSAFQTPSTKTVCQPLLVPQVRINL